MAWAPITWTDLVNTIASPNPNDLTKNAGVDGAWDADAISNEQIASSIENAGISFNTIPGLSGATGVGLSSTNLSRHWDTIEFCILRWSGDTPTIQIYESGVLQLDTGGMVWEGYKIIINALGQIEYWETETNTLIYTSLSAPSFPLFVDCSIDIYGFRIEGVLIDVGVVPPTEKIDHLMLTGIH